MSTPFPTTGLDTTTTLPTESASTPLSTNHVVAHTNLADAIIALETKVGVDGSADTDSLDYKLSGVTGSDKSASLTGTEALTNKTLTAPVITSPTLNLGSDAEGDTYYRNGAGALVRLAKGTDNYIYKMNGNVPNWEQETVTNNASTIVAGIVEEATQAEFDAGTDTGGTGARLFVLPSVILSKIGLLLFGDGSDGNVTISSNTTLTSDKYYNNLTIDNSYTLTTGGYRIFVLGTLTNNGTIANNGGNGSTGSSGAGTAGATGTLKGGGAGGRGGNSAGSSYLGGGGGGGGGVVWISARIIAVEGTIQAKGGNGANATNPGGINNTDSGIVGGSVAKTLIQSGSGGASGTPIAGGTISSSNTSTKNIYFMNTFFDALTSDPLGGGGGGGGGSASTTLADGGGGGQGGVIFLMYKTLTTSGTKTVTGGTAGTGAGTGNAGTAGSSGLSITYQVSI